jgi:serine/threonine protein kinase/tetratricopeptide (TPR) repeat protein
LKSSAPGQTWDEASSPAVERLVRRFEADWEAAATPRDHPDPVRYLDENAPPGARLALLRSEMALRWEAGDQAVVESYRDRFPDLDDGTLVALAYEEFCLREEHGEPPEASTFYARFPQHAAALRRVLEIHDLVGSARTATFNATGSAGLGPGSASSSIPFPEAGQTIGGFRLVEELGRGSFARVFRAEERQLADRPVALKVARAGSREPQTLARLQHTHIVPVHSYRTDPVTGLHLLCMPYLGGVTLDHLLADQQVRNARTGAELLEALDRLERVTGDPARPGAAGRVALAKRSYVRAIAWWGARLAEALQHAHERGVLHRDVKPSNVLVTADGLPLLLDFNLAWEPFLVEEGGDLRQPANLGGTLAYMAPEHLEALADDDARAVDARSDIYALGLVLYETMGSGPFGPMKTGRSLIETLRREARRRREGAEPLRYRHPEVPAEFAAVVERCLAPDPEHRYPTAGVLAADLQAVADDRPLVLAREPITSRAVRWVRRHRLALIVSVPVAAAITVAALALAQERRDHEMLIDDLRQMISRGMDLENDEELDTARAQFELAAHLAENPGRRQADEPDNKANGLRASLRLAQTIPDLRRIATQNLHLVQQKRELRAQADLLGTKAEDLRLRLLGFTETDGDPSDAVRAALQPFYVLESPTWPLDEQRIRLGPEREARLREDVEDLLFLWALALQENGPGFERRQALARTLIDRALSFTMVRGPWEAVRDGITPLDVEPATATARDNPAAETSDRACFYWGALRARQGRVRSAIAWLERANQLRQDRYWTHYYLAFQYQKAAEDAEHAQPLDRQLALAQYNVAIALREDRPWPRFNRAGLYQSLGAWSLAAADLESALARAGPGDRPAIGLNLGLIRQTLGDYEAARAAYDRVLAAAAPGDPIARAARLNRAGLDSATGRLAEARAEYTELIASDSRDRSTALKGRALAAQASGDLDAALADLDELIATSTPIRPDWLSLRSRLRLASSDPDGALADADAAYRLAVTPSTRRMLVRATLAAGRVEGLSLSDPDELDGLPLAGPGLMADLNRAADQLQGSPDGNARLTRAVLLLKAGRASEALDAAAGVLRLGPNLARPRLIRARLLARSGRTAEALRAVAEGVTLDPDDPRWIELRGMLRLTANDAEGALADLDAALRFRADPALHRARARALARLGRIEGAIEAAAAAARLDPEDPRPYIDRARLFVALGLWDQALADLEQASGRLADWPGLTADLAEAYASCLPARPDLIDRVTNLGRRAAEESGDFAP